MTETLGPAFQPDDDGLGGFQPDEGLGGFQTELLVVGGGTHWAPLAFHASHWRAGHWIEEAFVPEPPSLVGRHWVTQAFHATHWRTGHWHEGEAASSTEILGAAGFVLRVDAEFTFRSGLGPRPPTAIWVPKRRARRRRVALEGDAGLVLAADGEFVFRPAPLRRTRIPAEAGLVLEATATWRALDYVADVLIPEEDELLALL